MEIYKFLLLFSILTPYVNSQWKPSFKETFEHTPEYVFFYAETEMSIESCVWSNKIIKLKNYISKKRRNS